MLISYVKTLSAWEFEKFRGSIGLWRHKILGQNWKLKNWSNSHCFFRIFASNTKFNWSAL